METKDKSELHNAITVYIDNDKTPVDGTLIVETDFEVTPVVQVKWWDYLLEYLTGKLLKEDFKIHLAYDFELAPELLIWWDHETLAHVNLYLGNESNGDKYGFYNLIVQGAGGIKQLINDFTPTGIDRVFYDCLSFRRMIAAIKNLQPHEAVV